METATQYQRDIARIEAHKLALKDDEFSRLVEQVRDEVRLHEQYLRGKRGAAVVLNDRDPLRVTVENTDGLRSATFTFDELRHEIGIQGVGVDYSFAVDINYNGKPIVTGRKFGQLIPADANVVVRAVRNAIESVTDLPRPIKPRT
jgi:hypothetical protein